MQRTYQVGDRAFAVELEADASAPGVYRARVDGHELTVEVRPPTGSPRVLIVDGTSYPIASARDRDRTWVQVLAETFACDLVRGKRPAGAGGGRKDPEVKSPIAGKVLKLFVAPGDTVTAGQKLISVEAMKMENEIHASLAGKVARIAVTVGQPIQSGDLLLVIDPAA
jgi:biotin carboxyl carrier protein